MTTRKIIFSLLVTLSSLIVASQTFLQNGSTYIGKTKKEIGKITQHNHIKLSSTEKVGRITSITYGDSLESHQFFFARTFWFGLPKCISYISYVADKLKYEKAKADLLTNCEEKISEARAVQVAGTKKYLWHFMNPDKSHLFAFSVEKYSKKRNNR